MDQITFDDKSLQVVCIGYDYRNSKHFGGIGINANVVE